MDKNCEECLGELFSSQRIKLEELRIRLEELNKIHKEEITLLQGHIDAAIKLLQNLRELSPLWGKTYKKYISNFLNDRGL